MASFYIQPHGRLQEWVADENGYFKDEGLTYVFASGFDMGREKRSKGALETKYGAFESYKQIEAEARRRRHLPGQHHDASIARTP